MTSTISHVCLQPATPEEAGTTRSGDSTRLRSGNPPSSTTLVRRWTPTMVDVLHHRSIIPNLDYRLQGLGHGLLTRSDGIEQYQYYAPTDGNHRKAEHD